MAKQKPALNSEVTTFLDDLKHPLRTEIEQLRTAILSAKDGLTENIKWNGPNYCFQNEDRITMKIHPPKTIQLIFHRGAKVLEQPPTQLIADKDKLLVWKTNDRAVATFKNSEEIVLTKSILTTVINDWIKASASR